MDYLGLVFAGMLLSNALPHLIAGMQGHRFFTPWAKPRGVGRSSAVENALWGCANLAVGAWLVDRIFPKNLPHGLFALAFGFAAMSVAAALFFGPRQAD